MLESERLSDLSHPSTAHSWLWALSATHGPIIEEDGEFVGAVRVRTSARVAHPMPLCVVTVVACNLMQLGGMLVAAP